MRIDEAARAWFDKAITCRENDNSAPPPFPDFCVDVSLLDTARSQYGFRPQAFAYFRPDRMGYLPRPTTLICSECGLIEATKNPKQMGQRLSELSRACPHPKRPDDPANCSWGQLDVIFAHWSGSWKSAESEHDRLRPDLATTDQALCRVRQMREPPVRSQQGPSRLVELVVLLRELRNEKIPILGSRNVMRRWRALPQRLDPAETLSAKRRWRKSTTLHHRPISSSPTLYHLPGRLRNRGIGARPSASSRGIVERMVGLEGPPLSDAEVSAQLLSKSDGRGKGIRRDIAGY